MTARKRRGSLADAYERMQKIREAEAIRESQMEAARSYDPAQLTEADAEEENALLQLEGEQELREAAAKKKKRRRTTVYLDPEEYERIRACVLHLGAIGEEPVSISSFLDGAASRELERLAQKHNGGKPFPRHRSPLPGGTPGSSTG